MKTTLRITAMMVIGAMLHNMSFASLALAGDAKVSGDGTAVGLTNGNTNNNNSNAASTANAANNQSQSNVGTNIQGQGQGQNQKIENSGNSANSGNAVVNNQTPQQFINAPIGPGLMAVTVVPEAKNCVAISAQSFTLEEINNMAAGSFLEKKGGWWHGLFSSRIKSSVRVPFSGDQHSSGPITTLNWDAKVGFNLFEGEKRLGTFNCEGDYGYPLDATLGMCLKEAFEYTDMLQVYACFTVRTDAHSSGTAYSAGGAASGITDDVGVAGSVAGTFGTSVAYANKAYDVELFAVSKVARQIQIEPPAPKACNPGEIWAQINWLKAELKKCTRFCLNNLKLRLAIGNAFIELYVCTGDRAYLATAIKHFEIAERNYLRGWDIKSHQAEANSIIAEVYYNQGGCIWILQGKAAAMKFKAAKKLERIPSGFAR